MDYLNSAFDLDSAQLVDLLDELPFWSAPFGLSLFNSLRIAKHTVALDIGSGAGFPLTELAMRLGNSSLVYGIDPWKAAMERTHKKLNFYGIKNVKILEGRAESIPLADASVNLITSNNGLNNVQDLPKALAECARVSKRGNQFVQTLNLNTSMLEFYNVMEQVLKEFGLAEAAVQMTDHIYHKRKPLDEHIDLIEKAGFVVNDIVHDEFYYAFADGTTMLNHYFMRLAFLDGWKSFVPAYKREDVFAEVEAHMNRLAGHNGDFKLTIPFVVIDSSRK